MNSDYFVALARDLRGAIRREVRGNPRRAVTDPRERLIQFKTNIDVAMSVLDRNGLGDWLADRLVEIGDSLKDDLKLRIDVTARSVPRRSAPRRQPAGRAADPDGEEPDSGAEKQVKIALFRKAGEVAGARRGISEIVKWLNYVTEIAC